MPHASLRSLIRDRSRRDWFVIGETAHNHAGDLAYARRAIAGLCAMPEIGAVKIHMNLDLASYASFEFGEGEVYEKFVWPAADYGGLIDMVKTSGKGVVVLANDMESLDYLMARGDVDAIELHAVSLYDAPMLDRLTGFSGVVVLGVGGTELDEIGRALARLSAAGPKDVLMMYGFQNFPSDPRDVNLARMARIAALFDAEVGYADHTDHAHPDNAFVSTLGYAMGHRVLEKHFTPTPGEARIDTESSVGADTFAQIFHQLDLIAAARGDGGLAWSAAETAYGRYGVMKKAMVAARDLPAGHLLAPEDIRFKRTSRHLPLRQSDYDRFLGRRLGRTVAADTMLDFADLAPEEKA